MKDIGKVVLLLLGLGAIQTTLTQAWAPLGLADLLMAAAGLLALRLDFNRAVLTGAAAGLVQDSLAGGLIGLHAFAKTAVNAVLSSLGQFFVVRGQLASSVVVGIAAVAEASIVRLLLAFLGWPGAEPGSWIVGRGAVTAVVCAAFLVGGPQVVMMVNRRRNRSRIRLR